MKTLLTPAVYLMQRLRLLPKFALVALLFTAPLALVMSLLFSQLYYSVRAAEQERIGVRYVNQVQGAIRLVQRHRGLRHMQLSGNAGVASAASQIQQALAKKMAELGTLDTASAKFGVSDALREARESWDMLQSRMPAAKARDSYADHTALVARMAALGALVADRSGLTVDPEVDSYHLTTTLVNIMPGIIDGLSYIAGRGAAYIDTALLEANEDTTLNSSVMIARSDLARIPVQFDAAFRENPALRPLLEQGLAALPASLAFLNRAQDEVLNSFNQTSGSQFFEAGSDSIDALYSLANATAAALDTLLARRIERAMLQLALIGATVLAALGMAAFLLAGFYISFSHEVEKLEDAIRRAAGGDLTNRVTSKAKDEIGHLVNALGTMNTGLAQLVAQVRTGSESITRASSAIAAGNADLSARTEAQASTLEQTASSMEELTSVVKQNSDHAAEANRLVVDAAEVATRGGLAVEQMVGTMGEIKASSYRIIDIISVIDELAFRTNLLALNAAVEAAHAGEHGRGFAVVATEVRSLAQRSAGAAKEIKTLIETSVEKVDNGSRLADAAGKRMNEIVSSVRHVAGIMTDISAASREQTAGIEQVGDAIAQMDEVTQRNAALVEQAASAAGALHAQAVGLAQAVSVFKLDDSWCAAAEEAITPRRETTIRMLSKMNARRLAQDIAAMNEDDSGFLPSKRA